MNKTITTKELTFVFKKHIINDFNTPDNIISNRDSIFILYF